MDPNKGWVSFKEALAIDPDFLTKREAAMPGAEWTYDPERDGFYSRYGFAEYRVQLDTNGMPAFGRVIYGESANINAVVWGLDDDENVLIGVTIQERPLADNTDGTPARTKFAQPCVMGFNLEKVVGKDAALREASEEAGTDGAVIDIEHLGVHNPNPTFCATWSELYAIQVDLTKITGQTDRSELIYRVEFVELKELLRRIARSWHDGACYRSATANDAFFVWLSGVMMLDEIYLDI